MKQFQHDEATFKCPLMRREREVTSVLGYGMCPVHFPNKTMKCTQTSKKLKAKLHNYNTAHGLNSSYIIFAINLYCFLHTATQLVSNHWLKNLTETGEAISIGTCNRPALQTVDTYCILVQGDRHKMQSVLN